MLELLHIENIAVIESADISFRPGFNALTGETGAGKSIVIDAMSAVLGGRASRELIRTGADKAFVSAVFSQVPPTLPGLADNGVTPDEDGNLLLQREIGGDGKNVCRANGRPLTVTQLRQIGGELLNIHGQHDGQQSKRQPDAEQGKGKAAADGRNVAGAEFRQRKQLKRQHRKDAGHEIEQQTADYRCGKHCRQEIPAVGFGRIAADGGKRLAQNIFAVGFNGNFKFFSLGVRFVVKRQQADGGPAAVNADPGTLKSKSRVVADEYVKRFYRFRTVNGQCQHLSPGLHFF